MFSKFALLLAALPAAFAVDSVVIEGNRAREDIIPCDICAGGGAAQLVLNDNTMIGNQAVDGTALVQLIDVIPYPPPDGLGFTWQGLVTIDITTNSRRGTVDAITMGTATCTDSLQTEAGAACIGLSFVGQVTVPAGEGSGYFSNRECSFNLMGSLLVGREPFETQNLVGECWPSGGNGNGRGNSGGSIGGFGGLNGN